MKLSDIATQDELRSFLQRSNLHAAWYVTFNWLCVAAIFAGVALWTHPISILIGIALLGGRQMAFAALMHDCGHRALFASRWANAWVGQWLCAYPILSDQPRYMKGHWQHHIHAGTHNDPDLPNYQAYPVTRESFRRKVLRDLTGRTGWKALRATWHRGRHYLDRAPWNGNALLGHAIVNGAMLAALAATGNGWLYLMWPVAFMTSYMLIARLRQVAEHGGVPDLFDGDPRKHTRTTGVRWIERLFVAPFHLNYHLEHHLLAGVPCYRLPAFHRFLMERGALDDTPMPHGYGELFDGLIAGSRA